jgi:hypothetical protein
MPSSVVAEAGSGGSSVWRREMGSQTRKEEEAKVGVAEVELEAGVGGEEVEGQARGGGGVGLKPDAGRGVHRLPEVVEVAKKARG